MHCQTHTSASFHPHTNTHSLNWRRYRLTLAHNHEDEEKIPLSTHVCGLLHRKERTTQKSNSPQTLQIASLSEKLSSFFWESGRKSMFDHIWRRKSKFGWLKEHKSGGFRKEISAEAQSNKKTPAEVFTAAGSMRGGELWWTVLRLCPPRTKDQRWFIRLQPATDDQSQVHAWWGGRDLELSSQLILICMKPFSSDKLRLFLLRGMFWAAVAVGPGPGRVHELIGQRQMLSPCPSLRCADRSISTSTRRHGQMLRSRCLVDHRPPTETCFVVGICLQTGWEKFVVKVVNPEEKESFSVAVNVKNKR